MDDFRPEIRLLLSCARTSLEPEGIEKVGELLRLPLDWSEVLPLAEGHGILPLLYRNLKNTFRGLIPEAILEKLRQKYYTQAGRNLFLTNELFRILNLFEERGIPIIPFKGPALAASVYGDITLRPFGDLDLLVHRKDLPEAKRLLLSKDYYWSFPLTGDLKEAFLQAGDGCFLQRADGKVIVEIDAEITNREFPVSLDTNLFWKRIRRNPLEDRTVQAFSLEDLFLILCLHGSKHCWERLIWVCDLAEMIRMGKGPDWGRILEEARKLGCERMLFFGFSLAARLLHSPIPPELPPRIQEDPAVRELCGYALRRFSGKAPNEPLIGLALTSYNLQLGDFWHDKAAYCLRLAFIPTVLDWEFVPLPSFLFFLYYCIHPLRLAGKYGWNTGRRFLQKAGCALVRRRPVWEGVELQRKMAGRDWRE